MTRRSHSWFIQWSNAACESPARDKMSGTLVRYLFEMPCPRLQQPAGVYAMFNRTAAPSPCTSSTG